MTGTTRSISSAAGTGSAPGRVDSPPISRMSAPASAIARARAKCLRQAEVQAAVREAVGGHVQDPHEPRPVEREAADRRPRRAQAGGDFGRDRGRRQQQRRRAAAVLGDLGEPERAAGEAAARRPAAARRSAGSAGSGRSCDGPRLEQASDQPGQLGKVGEGGGVRQRLDRRVAVAFGVEQEAGRRRPAPWRRRRRCRRRRPVRRGRAGRRRGGACAGRASGRRGCRRR